MTILPPVDSCSPPVRFSPQQSPSIERLQLDDRLCLRQSVRAELVGLQDCVPCRLRISSLEGV